MPDILIDANGIVVAEAETITDTGAGWDVDGAIYPAGLERMQAVTPPANVIGRYTYAGGVFTALPDDPAEAAVAKSERLAAPSPACATSMRRPASPLADRPSQPTVLPRRC